MFAAGQRDSPNDVTTGKNVDGKSQDTSMFVGEWFHGIYMSRLLVVNTSFQQTPLCKDFREALQGHRQQRHESWNCISPREYPEIVREQYIFCNREQ